jgi:hypothetical protein
MNASLLVCVPSLVAREAAVVRNKLSLLTAISPD